MALAGGCGPRDVIDLVRDPSPAHIAFYLMLAPLLLVLAFFRQLVLNLLPPWFKTRRALWTGIGLLAAATAGAVAYWSHAGPR